MTALGVWVCCVACLVCLFDPPSFFLPSHLSLYTLYIGGVCWRQLQDSLHTAASFERVSLLRDPLVSASRRSHSNGVRSAGGRDGWEVGGGKGWRGGGLGESGDEVCATGSLDNGESLSLEWSSALLLDPL